MSYSMAGRLVRGGGAPYQRIQLTTDGFGAYRPVVDALWRNGIDYAQIVKEYGTQTRTRCAAIHP